MMKFEKGPRRGMKRREQREKRRRGSERGRERKRERGRAGERESLTLIPFNSREIKEVNGERST